MDGWKASCRFFGLELKGAPDGFGRVRRERKGERREKRESEREKRERVESEGENARVESESENAREKNQRITKELQFPTGQKFTNIASSSTKRESRERERERTGERERRAAVSRAVCLNGREGKREREKKNTPSKTNDYFFSVFQKGRRTTEEKQQQEQKTRRRKMQNTRCSRGVSLHPIIVK